MNRLTGTIASIEQSGSIMLVDIDAAGERFSVLMIRPAEVPTWLHTGKSIGLIFKETEVSIAKHLSGTISVLNRFPCVIESIRRGDILSIIEMTCAGHTIMSAITTRSADELQLRAHETVTAFITSNEITLSEVKE
jgi:molybdate transport system regulatory protein